MDILYFKLTLNLNFALSFFGAKIKKQSSASVNPVIKYGRKKIMICLLIITMFFFLPYFMFYLLIPFKKGLIPLKLRQVVVALSFREYPIRTDEIFLFSKFQAYGLKPLDQLSLGN
jgi:hypothetical protein